MLCCQVPVPIFADTPWHSEQTMLVFYHPLTTRDSFVSAEWLISAAPQLTTDLSWTLSSRLPPLPSPHRHVSSVTPRTRPRRRTEHLPAGPRALPPDTGRPLHGQHTLPSSQHERPRAERGEAPHATPDAATGVVRSPLTRLSPRSDHEERGIRGEVPRLTAGATGRDPARCGRQTRLAAARPLLGRSERTAGSARWRTRRPTGHEQRRDVWLSRTSRENCVHALPN